MKIDSGKFWLLSCGAEKSVYAAEVEAIKAWKEAAKAGADPEKTMILEVDASKEKWAITQVSGMKIAMGLVMAGE